MDRGNAQQIYALLGQFLADRLPVEEFEDGIVPLAWGASRETDPELFEVVGAIELALAEHSSGHATAEEVRELLLPYAPLVAARRWSRDLRPPPHGAATGREQRVRRSEW